MLLGETQQVTVNGHVAKGDAQQAAGPTHGLPSHRFRLALEWDASAARYVGKGCYVNVRVFFFAFLVLGAGGKGLFWADWTVAVQMAFAQQKENSLYTV